MDSFERYATGGLELAGIPYEELDLQIMRVADSIYGPPLRALQAADLRHVEPEPDLDPSRPPAAG